MDKFNYKYYGAKCTAEEIRLFIAHQLKLNFERQASQTPLCIWGTHGIGKTQMVEQVAHENAYQYSYVAPAQFEEMGDLLGMPHIVEKDGEKKTIFAPPEWVPSQSGPGILLIDDVNRADDRILRGIMQLLQNHALGSWQLPEKWQIILTANPEGGDYSVTTMDDAMLTRMLHVTMQFEPKQWALWAEQNGIDPRGINFVLTYPEVVQGGQTTPRSLVQFFQSIHHIENLKQQSDLVYLLALSSLDKSTANTFMSFVDANLERLISPEDILTAKDFSKNIQPKISALVNKTVKRVDILATLSTRLINYCLQHKLNKQALENLTLYLKMALIPEDLRLSLVQDLSKHKALKSIIADPQLAMLVLKV